MKPVLFESLADQDECMDLNRFETALLREGSKPPAPAQAAPPRTAAAVAASTNGQSSVPPSSGSNAWYAS